MDKPYWFMIAEGEIGVKEIPGPKHNGRILEYHATTTYKAKTDEISWCSSFVNWCIVTAGKKGTNLANARSWLNWGEPLKTPVLGCVVVFSRGTNPAQGHVGFYAGETDGFIRVLGGNQGNEVKISNYAKGNLLGYRWPDDEPLCYS